MVTQRVEIELPESVYRQLARVSKETSQPIELIAAQSIISNLPPSAGDVLPDFRAELLKIQTLEMSDLLTLVRETATEEASERQSELLNVMQKTL